MNPVVMEPLQEEWRLVRGDVEKLLQDAAKKEEEMEKITRLSPSETQGKDRPNYNKEKKARDKYLKDAEEKILAFLEYLKNIKILDPACGTGNFLYVTMDLMKQLETEVFDWLSDVTGKAEYPFGLNQINPSQFLGIEVDERAAEIADLVIWIGYLQWHFRRNGYTQPETPILRAFGNIEKRDAVLAYDGEPVPDVDRATGEVRTRWGGGMMVHPVTGEEVPDPSDQKVIYKYLNPRSTVWPEADYIVSNPPFVGNFSMREILGDGYVESLREVYKKVIPETSDYVMFWWKKSAELLKERKIDRFGLITTNSITQIQQRRVIEPYLSGKDKIEIDFAIPDHPWVSGSAAVRIAMTAASKDSLNSKRGIVIEERDENNAKVRIESVDRINSDLSSGVDVTASLILFSNSKLAGPGVKLHGAGFLVSYEQYQFWGCKYPNIVKPYRNGRDLTAIPRNLFVIDFFGLKVNELSNYPEPY